jgi:hypothetical protein
MGSLFLSALFPTTAQVHAAAEMLERRGDILLAIETDPSQCGNSTRGRIGSHSLSLPRVRPCSISRLSVRPESSPACSTVWRSAP